jgi:hypothetical protein
MRFRSLFSKVTIRGQRNAQMQTKLVQDHTLFYKLQLNIRIEHMESRQK